MKLKIKLLLGIFLLLLITTGSNIFYSYTTFINDKKAYLFDTILNKTENLSDQISMELKLADIQSDNLRFLQDLNQSNLTESFAAKITTDESYKNPTINFINENSPYYSREYIDSFINLIQSSSNNPIINRLQFVKANDDFYIYKNFINSNERTYTTILFSAQKISDFFKPHSQLQNFLILQNNKDKSLGAISSDDTVLDEFKASKLSKSAIETKNALDPNQDILLAMNRNQEFNFIIGSSISTDMAFRTTKEIVTRSAFFSLFLLGIFIIIGILFSSQITTPINELIAAAKDIANGIYNYKENIKTHDELKVLGMSFEKMNNEINDLLNTKEEMIQELDSANVQLDEYNRNLEQMVSDRTRQLHESNNFIKAMINSLDQGLVVFDANLDISPIFTKASLDVFEQSPENKKFTELIRKNSPDEESKIEQWAQVTFNNLLPFESAMALGPTSMQLGEGIESSNYKFVDLKYYPMKDEDDKITNIVAVATDKTKEQISEHNFKKQEAYVEMILKILKNKTSFHSFIQEVNNIFVNFKNCYNEDENTLNLELAMMLFHTLNGGFGLYRMLDLQKQARRSEQFIIDNKTQSNASHASMAEELYKQVLLLKNNFIYSLEDLDRTLGTNFLKQEKTREIKTERIHELYENLKTLKNNFNSNPTLMNEINDFENEFLDDFIKLPISDLFATYQELCDQTAKKIGKKINPIAYSNPDFKLNPETYEEFINVLIHLFRNNLDHGIETPSKREGLNKNPSGTISIEAKEDNSSLVITISDDGQGINPAIIRAKMKKINPDYDLESESDAEVIYRIFEPYFSTREEVSELSGRGVGMSAIKEVVESMNGSIEIHSEINRGTSFRFIFPKN